MSIIDRKSIRLQNYDYSENGCYFITICTQNKRKTLCRIAVGEGSPLPQLTRDGMILKSVIEKTESVYPTVQIDKYVIMPNHVHILLTLDGNDQGGSGDRSPTIMSVIGWLKFTATKEINTRQNSSGQRIFQRSFYDHVVRNDIDYLNIRSYIDNNPAKWTEDRFCY